MNKCELYKFTNKDLIIEVPLIKVFNVDDKREYYSFCYTGDHIMNYRNIDIECQKIRKLCLYAGFKVSLHHIWFPIIDDKLDMFVKIVNRTFGSELTHIEEDMNLYRSPDKINVQQRRYYGKIL